MTTEAGGNVGRSLTRREDERLLTGAPPMAPLLFPNLVVLALIGLSVFGRRLPDGSTSSVPAA